MPDIAQALDVVQRDVDGLSTSCSETSAALASTRATTAELLAAMDQVQRTLETSEKRSQLVQTFLEQYQLSPAELDALQVCTALPGVLCCSILMSVLEACCLLEQRFQGSLD